MTKLRWLQVVGLAGLLAAHTGCGRSSPRAPGPKPSILTQLLVQGPSGIIVEDGLGRRDTLSDASSGRDHIPWAYAGQALDQQLDRATSEFVNDPSRNRFDRSRKVASLSMIFKWFAEDFEARSGSVLRFIADHVQDPSLKQELLAGDYTVQFLDYDWHLNGPSP